ncbi:MAG: hypothetical protein RL023_47 [Candidatus Parcubacteria bacterium]|jgi:GTPase SAR1 family protein
MPSSKTNLLLTILSKLQGKRDLAEYFSLMLQETEVSEEQLDTLIVTIADAIKHYRQKQQQTKISKQHLQELKEMQEAEEILQGLATK